MSLVAALTVDNSSKGQPGPDEVMIETLQAGTIQEERKEGQKAACELIHRQHGSWPFTEFAVRDHLPPALPYKPQLRRKAADREQEYRGTDKSGDVVGHD